MKLSLIMSTAGVFHLVRLQENNVQTNLKLACISILSQTFLRAPVTLMFDLTRCFCYRKELKEFEEFNRLRRVFPEIVHEEVNSRTVKKYRRRHSSLILERFQ